MQATRSFTGVDGQIMSYEFENKDRGTYKIQPTKTLTREEIQQLTREEIRQLAVVFETFAQIDKNLFSKLPFESNSYTTAREIAKFPEKIIKLAASAYCGDQTILSQCVETGDVKLVKLFIDKGADVNAADYNRAGTTALYRAIVKYEAEQSIEMVKCLLDHGAKVEAICDEQPMIYWAKRTRFEAAIPLLFATKDPVAVKAQINTFCLVNKRYGNILSKDTLFSIFQYVDPYSVALKKPSDLYHASDEPTDATPQFKRGVG